MSRRGSVLALVCVGLLVAAGSWWARREAPSDDTQARVTRIAMARPHWSDEAITTSVDASTRAVEGLRARGVEDPRAWLAERLATVHIAESDKRAFYDLNRATFGERAYPEVQTTCERLLAYEVLRRDLELPSGSALRYPAPLASSSAPLAE